MAKITKEYLKHIRYVPAQYLSSMFIWGLTHQGHEYWADFYFNKKPITEEAQAILDEMRRVHES